MRYRQYFVLMNNGVVLDIRGMPYGIWRHHIHYLCYCTNPECRNSVAAGPIEILFRHSETGKD